MKITEFLDKMPTNKLIRIQNSYSKTIEEFYHNVIKQNIPSKETILKWDTLLNKYIEDRDAIFFIRKYGSASSKQWNLIRRGFLTEFENARFIYCDNFLAHYFFSMAIEEFTPNYEDFRDTMINMRFPYGYMETREEIPYRASPKGKPAKLNNHGWKLAHINSVDNNDYSFEYKTKANILFTRGEQKDWSHDGRYCSRKIKRTLPIEDLELIKAHFLRLVHPINHFLVPRNNLHSSDFGNNIGEFKELIDFMKAIQKKEYPDVIEQYEKKTFTMQNSTTIHDPSETVINIKALTTPKALSNKDKIKKHDNINNVSKSNKQTRSKTIMNKIDETNEELIISVLKGYLIEGMSHREIEKEILKIESEERGGGFKAMTILHDFDIKGDRKSILKNRTIEDEIKDANGKYLEALILLKSRHN